MKSKTLNWLELGSIINQTVQHYKSDLVHDGIVFAQHIGKQFVYQVRPTGTWLFEDGSELCKAIKELDRTGARYFRLTVNSINNGPDITATEITCDEI